jgi:type IV pilus assembly protein PilC
MAATLTFQYSVRDRAGKIISGKIDAESPSAVASKLRSMGYAPVSISQARAAGRRELSFGGKKGVKLKDLAVMSRQFATMINSGLSLLRALSILADQTESKTLARVLGEVRADVEAGVALSTSLGKHPQVFPLLMVNMCRAGEVGGFLDSVLLQVAENYEAEVKLRGKIKSAMTYPVVVFVFAILAVVGMLLFIVPTFAAMFSTLGGELPAPTRVLVWMSSMLKLGGPVLLVAAIAGFFTWKKSSTTSVCATSRTRSCSSCRSSASSFRRSRCRASLATSER